MNKKTILETIKAHNAVFQDLGIQSMYLYGSFAHDQATRNSDIDLFYEYKNPAFSLFEQMEAQETLETLLKRRVDLVSKKALHPAMKKDIEKSAIVVF